VCSFLHLTTVQLPYSTLTITDVRLYAGTVKRPDVSYRIRPRAMPNPPPAWAETQSLIQM